MFIIRSSSCVSEADVGGEIRALRQLVVADLSIEAYIAKLKN